MARKTSKAKASKAKAEVFSTEILQPFWEPDHFKPDGDTAHWLEHRRPRVANALMQGFNSDDEETRQACWILMQDLETLTCAAAHALGSEKRVEVQVRMRPGSTAEGYLESLSRLARVVAFAPTIVDTDAATDFVDLADLLLEHMEAIGKMELSPRTAGEVAA